MADVLALHAATGSGLFGIGTKFGSASMRASQARMLG